MPDGGSTVSLLGFGLLGVAVLGATHHAKGEEVMKALPRNSYR